MIRPEPLQLIEPDWPAPANVRAVFSTRIGGCSRGAYAGANLGDRVADDPAAVAINRELLAEQTGIVHWPWLWQVHGVDLVNFSRPDLPTGACADAVYTSQTGLACAVLTADCLPLLLCDTNGTQVAAVHAGWRGLAAGVINNAVASFPVAPEDLLVYLGPAIGPQHFEVGEDVYHACDALFARMSESREWRENFVPADRPKHFFADLYGLAHCILTELGVHRVFGGNFCTYADSERFYSYRRDGVTGRMVSAIWLQA
jgi:YfiH family protein